MDRLLLKFILILLFLSLSLHASPSAKPSSQGVKKNLQIVIDPGHGGKDPGAISKNRIREKDVVLSIAKKLSTSLKKRLGAEVALTRSKDQFITLERRNRIANERRCDLFLSIHANASRNRQAEGMEIYYLNKATDQASRRLARRENAGAPKAEKEIEGILSDLVQTASTEESAEISQHLRRSLQKRLMKRYPIAGIRVKTALFYVLVGAKCPSLLVETGFITHPREGKRLKSAGFQATLAEAIADGVAAYFEGIERGKGDL